MAEATSPDGMRSDSGRVLVVFDDMCGVCQGAVGFVKRFDWLHRFEFEGYTTAMLAYPEIAASDLDEGVRARFPADGSITVGIDAVRSIAMRTPLGALWAWTLYIPPVRWLGRKAYCWFAARRHTVCRLVPRNQ